MANGQLGTILHQVCRLPGSSGAEPPTDRQLLERFALDGNQDAFTALVVRHGSLVLGVCRGVLRDAHDAEDAFQATWLVLARKAKAVRWSDSVAGWLQQVAYRVALKARARSARAREQERQLRDRGAVSADRDEELLAVLQAELARLPEKYRGALVLCYLQGKTNVEAARELGWPPGSMSRRLARARDLLRDRLAGRGVLASGAALASLRAQLASAAVPPPLGQATVLVAAGSPAAAGVCPTVSTLVEGVLGEMYLKSLKSMALAALVASALCAGVGAFAYRTWAAERPAAVAADPEPRQRPAPPRSFRSQLALGVYQIVGGEPAPKLLGITGSWARKPVAIPAGANWYVQPIGGGNFGGGNLLGGVGGVNLGGAGALGGIGGGGLNLGGMPGGFNLGGGGLLGGVPPGVQPGGGGLRGGVGGKRPAAGNPAPNFFGARLTGKELKALVAEMKKQSVPGLSIQNLGFADADLAELKEVSGLQTLLLRGSQISNEGLKHLAAFRYLRTLALEGTPVTEEGLKQLAELKGLTSLRLGGSKVDDKGLAHLRDLKWLRSLRLTWTSVGTEGLGMLSALPALETLELAGEFADKDLPALKSLAALKTLRLHQTQVSDAGLADLKPLAGLKALSIDAYWAWDGNDTFLGGVIGGGVGGIGGGHWRRG